MGLTQLKKVLVIDDNEDILSVIIAQFKKRLPEVKVVSAQSGKSGIQAAQKEKPDVILLDVVMPGLNGFDVCKVLKAHENTKHIPIIMLTAVRTGTEDRVRGLDSGADAFLAKPIEAAELVAQVKVLLRIKEAEDKLRSEKSTLKDHMGQKLRELQAAKGKQQETEECFRALFEQIPLPLALLRFIPDKDDKPVKLFFTEVNRAFEETFDTGKEDVAGKELNDLLPALSPEGVQGFEKAAAGEAQRFEVRMEKVGCRCDIQVFPLHHGTIAAVFVKHKM